MTMLRALFLASVALTVPAAVQARTQHVQSTKAKPELGTWGIDLSGRDTSVKPGDDFWKHVNGTWDKTVAIPAESRELTILAAVASPMAAEQPVAATPSAPAADATRD